MDDVFLLDMATGRQIQSRPFRSETELRRYVVRHAQLLLGLTVLASEYPISTNGGGRMDAIAIDRGGSPTVVEFKRLASGTAICQGLYYLDWLEYHRDIFAMLVVERCGEKTASKIAWGEPRLVCVAEEFGEREEAVARQIGRAVELVRLRRHATSVAVVQRPQNTRGARLQGG